MTHNEKIVPDWPDQKDLIRRVTGRPRWGLLTDVDGTISQIVDVPSEATVEPAIRELLSQLAQHATVVAAISGRAADDIRQRVGVPELSYIGNHGFERWENGELRPNAAVDPYLPALAHAKKEVESDAPAGMWVEDKGATLSVHYRQTADPAAVKEVFGPRLQKVADRLGINLFSGRMVFELRPPIECNKGTAAVALVDEYNLDGALFLGDDVTDADAMNALHQLQTERDFVAVTVGVYSTDMPVEVARAADCLASGVDGVSSLLTWLLNDLKAS